MDKKIQRNLNIQTSVFKRQEDVPYVYIKNYKIRITDCNLFGGICLSQTQGNSFSCYFSEALAKRKSTTVIYYLVNFVSVHSIAGATCKCFIGSAVHSIGKNKSLTLDCKFKDANLSKLL